MSPKYLVAAVLAALMSAPLSAQSVKAGIEAWQKADYGGAVAIWRPLAEKGDADAQFNLGQAFRLGRGVPINLGAAKTWFERAAATGHVDAETTLGLILFQNGDRPQGINWLKKAAEQDEPRAQLVYGTALYNGDGVAQDRMHGYFYVTRAAAKGLAAARDTLAQLDQLMPAADRQRAMALGQAKSPSRAKPKVEKTVLLAQADPRPKPRAKPASKPIQRVPSPAKAASAVRASGAWRIQLGAFAQRAAAETLYKRVSAKPVLSGRSAFYVPVGSVTRLQVGPFETKASASAACGSVGTACFAVPAG